MPKNKQKTILHFISALDQIGGTEMMLQRTVPHLKSYHHIFVAASGRGVLSEKLSKNYHVYNLGYRRLPDLVRTIKRLIYILRNENPNLIITYLIHSDLIGRIAAKLAGNYKVVCFNRGSLLNWKFLRIADFFTKNLVYFYLTNSQTQKSKLVKMLRLSVNNIKVIPNGLDPSRVKVSKTRQQVRGELGIGKNDFVLGYVGRLRQRKGLEILIRAVADINDADYKLVIVGDGHLRDNLVQLVNDLGLKRTVIFTGTQKNVFNYYQSFDIFVLPTLEEGMPNVLIEAMASRVPIITSDIPECKEVTGDCAIYFKVRNVKDLRDKIIMLSKQSSMMSDLAIKGYHRFRKHFSINNTINKINEFYSEHA